MRRLSLNSSPAEQGYARLVFIPRAIVYNNDGCFIEDENGVRHAGACISCKEKTCIEYKDSELNTPLFQAFPHNTSKRVCPTHAISYDQSTGLVSINQESCIACSLCIHRCPVAAIQIDLSTHKCFVNCHPSIVQTCSDAEHETFLNEVTSTPINCSFTNLPEGFSEVYHNSILNASKRIADVSEIIVRNTLVNMGIPCNTNAAGNNHNRTEFFGQQGNMVIIGESNSSDTDTLSVTRRILDDEAVMVSRYGLLSQNILSLSVINGFPNKRTDYYEVVHDIKSILGIQVSTVTYHVLFILNLFGVRLSITDLSSFFIDSSNQNLLPVVKKFIPNIDSIDKSSQGAGYRPIK